MHKHHPRFRPLYVILLSLIAIGSSWALIQTVLANSIYIIDNDGALRPSVALIDGKPVVSYYDNVNMDLKVASCGDAACTTFTNTLRVVDSVGSVGSSSALVVIDSKPVIAYTDFTTGALKVAACVDANCNAPATITIVDNQISLTAYPSMTVVNGNPVIAYQETPSKTLNVAACVDPSCAQPATITTVDTSPDVAGISSITVIGGNPIISYYDQTNRDLKVAACVDSACASAATITAVDTTGNVGSNSSIMIVNGKPLISYSGNSAFGLKVAACVDVACSSPATITTLDNIEIHRTSIAMIGANPVIAYGTLSGGGYRLKLATCNNLTCTSATTTTLTGIVDSGIYPSMVELNNYPAIGYYDIKNSQIRFYYGGDEGYGLTTTPTPSPTITPTLTLTPLPTQPPTPAQVGTLVPQSPGNADNFGYAVAISGDTIVVGAPNRSYSALTNAGAAYVYQWNGAIWAFQAELLPSDAASNQFFGNSVGIFADSVVVGAYGDAAGGSSSGAAYVFTRSGTLWTQQTKLTSPDPASDDAFGYSVSISVESVLIGAYGDDEMGNNSGAAYVFIRQGVLWDFQQKLTAGDPLANGGFGYAVDLYGDRAVIGAPFPSTQTGSAYIFRRVGSEWSQETKIVPSPSYINAGDGFGSAVAIYNDTVVIGAPYSEGSVAANMDDGSIYAYTRSDSSWTLDTSSAYAIPSAVPSTTPQHGGQAVDVYRETFLAGVPYWQPIGGQSVGRVDVYASPYYLRSLQATPASTNGLFGWSVARDGQVVVVGAPYVDFASFSDSGAAYIYQVEAPPWQATASLTPTATPTNTPTATYTPTLTQTPPTPTSPPNATMGRNFYSITTPTLTWSVVSWAAGYQIQVDDDPNFGSPIEAEFETDVLSYTTPELANGTYYWRVRAKRDATTWGNWSAIEVFVVSAG